MISFWRKKKRKSLKQRKCISPYITLAILFNLNGSTMGIPVVMVNLNDAKEWSKKDIYQSKEKKRRERNSMSESNFSEVLLCNRNRTKPNTCSTVLIHHWCNCQRLVWNSDLEIRDHLLGGWSTETKLSYQNRLRKGICSISHFHATVHIKA